MKDLIIFIFPIIFLNFSYIENSENRTKAIKLIENLDEDHLYGIDFSHYSGEVDWDDLLNTKREISFMFLRATYGIDVDFNYCDNIEEALCRDYFVGSYHYFRPDECGYKQAYNYVNTISSYNEHFLPVLDAESSYPDVTADELRCEWQDWLLYVEETLCVTPIIYSNLRFWKHYIRDFPEFDRYPLWIAAYSPEKREEEVMGIAHIYQFSDNETIEGFKKRVDGNIIAKEKLLAILR